MAGLHYSVARAARRPSERTERCAAGLTVVGLVGIAAFWWAAHPYVLRYSTSFFATYGTGITLSHLFATIVLIWRARLVRDAASARAAAAFAFSVPVIAFSAITVPGVGPAWLWQHEASGWAWFGWRIGWPLFLVWYAVGSRSGPSVRRAVLVAAAWGVAVVALALSGVLPQLYLDPTPRFTAMVFVADGLALLSAVAALVLLAARRPFTSLDLWLGVALVLTAASELIVLTGTSRYSPAADAIRLLALAANLAIACGLIAEFAHLLARTTELDRFMTMAQYSAGIVYVLDARGACTYVNQGWISCTGQPREEALGSGWLRCIHPDDLVDGRSRCASDIAAGRPYALELRYRCRDGSYRWHLAQATPMHDADGTFMGWYGTATDVDAHHQALEDARRLQAEASARERDVRRIAETIPLMAWTAEANGEISWYNRRWYDYTGQRPEDARGWGWQTVHHPEDLPEVQRRWRESLQTGTPFEMEFRLRGADGRFRWFMTRAHPIADEHGRVITWYGTNTDIDERRRHGDELAERYAHERRVSHLLQSAFLPPFLPKVDGLTFQAVYRPATSDAEVGGDWYDAFVLRDGRIALSIGDVCGHGLEAASAMVRLREALRAVTGFIDTDAALIIETANRSFASSHPDEIATVLFAIYDPVSRRLSVANAGHPPPALVRDGRVTLLPYGDVPLGVEAERRFSVETLVLEPGDVLVLYTDGLIEADRDVPAGEARLLEALAVYADDAEELVSRALAVPQRDDVAVLMLAVADAAAGQSSWHFSSDDAASAADARPAFTAHLRRRNLDPETIAVAELVFGELVGNVVRHAPGPIEIELRWRDDEPLLVARDRGPSFTIGSIGLPGNSLSENGRGLYLICAFASLPVVAPRFGGGNEVIVALTPSPAVPRREEAAV